SSARNKFRDLLGNGDAIATPAAGLRKPAILASLWPFVNPKFRFYSEIPKKCEKGLGSSPQFLDGVPNGLSILRVGRLLKVFLQFAGGALTVAALFVNARQLQMHISKLVVAQICRVKQKSFGVSERFISLLPC